MKKMILILLFAAGIGLNVSAQVQKGAMLLGGMVGFTHYNNDKDSFSNDQITGNHNSKSSIFTIIPRFGYFVGNTFELGIGAGYSYRKSESSMENDNSSYGYSQEDKEKKFKINPYLSKYFKISEKFYITGTFNLIAGFGKYNSIFTPSDSSNERDEEYNLFDLDINVTPGITYFINKNWALSGNIGQIYYSWSKKVLDTDVEDKPNDSFSGFGFDMSFNTFAVGIQYYLNN